MVWNKDYLKEKISKQKIPFIGASILTLLVAGHLLLKKTPEKSYEEILTFTPLIKSERSLAEFYDNLNEGFDGYFFTFTDSPIDYLIIKNEPPRYQNLEGVIAEYYPKTKPYIYMIKKSIEEHKDIFHLDSLIVSILMNAESRCNPYAVSKAGAVGLMQLIPETAEKMGLKIYETDIYDKLKEARKNMIEAYSSAIRAMKQENYERSTELFKKYNFYVNEADLLHQEYETTLINNETLDDRLNPKKNIWAGVKYLAILASLNMDDRNIASLRSIIAAYNFRGEDAAEEWTLPTIDEPIKHANIVIEPYRILRPLAMKPPVVYVE